MQDNEIFLINCFLYIFKFSIYWFLFCMCFLFFAIALNILFQSFIFNLSHILIWYISCKKHQPGLKIFLEVHLLLTSHFNYLYLLWLLIYLNSYLPFYIVLYLPCYCPLLSIFIKIVHFSMTSSLIPNSYLEVIIFFLFF